MRTISVHLQEGFEGDLVMLMAGDQIVGEKDLVTTRHQIGFATKIDIQVEDGIENLTVIIRGLGRRSEQTVLIGDEPYLGVNLTRTGEIEVSKSEAAFCYV